MAHRNYLIRYANGFKRHASQAEIDLLGPNAAKVGPREYFCTSYQTDLDATAGPDYLPGKFTIEFKQSRYSERLETTKHLIERLPGLIDALARSAAQAEVCPNA